MSKPDRLFRRDRTTGVIKIALKTPRGRQWVSTGEITMKRAHEVCDQAMIDQLQLAANAGVLSADAISRLTVGRRIGCMDVFKAWKEEKALDFSEETLRGYETTLLQFLASEERRNKPVNGLTRRPLDQFVNAPGISIATRRARLAALRSYFGFACAAGYTLGDISKRIVARKRDLLFIHKEKKTRPQITADEYATIMASPKIAGFWRWATAIGYCLGLRISDVACLEWASIKEDVVIVHTRKRGGRTELSLDDPLYGGGELRRIFAEMREHLVSDRVFCFPQEREKAIDPTKRAQLSWGYIRVLNRCGIVGKSFHGLRHAFATRLKTSGIPIAEIRDAMAHSDEETTEKYVHVD